MIFFMLIVISGIINTLYRPPKSFVFGYIRVTSKILGIWYTEHSWGSVKIIKSGKISDIGSELSILWEILLDTLSYLHHLPE